MNTQSDTRINTLVTTDPAENEWKRLFVSTEHWRSDLKFFADELQFLRTLLDRHFMNLIQPENIESTKSAVVKVGKLENKRYIFEQKIDRHFDHMKGLIENPFPRDAQTYREEHSKLEAIMVEFLMDFRRLKKEIFNLARQVMDAEKTNHLLSS